MLQLAGYDLNGDNVESDVQDFLNKFLPTSSFKPWLTPSYPGWNLGALTTVNGQKWGEQFELNKMWWPSGASRFSYGHYLCSSDVVNSIMAVAYGTSGKYNLINLSIGNPEYNQGGTIVAGETMNTQVYLLPPTPLSGIRNLTGQIQSLYLLTVVDPRYFWPWYNIGNISITPTTTWQSLITMIAGILNVTINVDTISPNYLAPSLNAYSLPYESVPAILDSIAYNIGMRFVAMYNGTYAMQLYNTALTNFNNDMSAYSSRMIMAGGNRFASPL
jgi:hypothetical protein